jgi:hypothetical protein
MVAWVDGNLSALCNLQATALETAVTDVKSHVGNFANTVAQLDGNIATICNLVTNARSPPVDDNKLRGLPPCPSSTGDPSGLPFRPGGGWSSQDLWHAQLGIRQPPPAPAPAITDNGLEPVPPHVPPEPLVDNVTPVGQSAPHEGIATAPRHGMDEAATGPPGGSNNHPPQPLPINATGGNCHHPSLPQDDVDLSYDKNRAAGTSRPVPLSPYGVPSWPTGLRIPADTHSLQGMRGDSYREGEEASLGG